MPAVPVPVNQWTATLFFGFASITVFITWFTALCMASTRYIVAVSWMISFPSTFPS